MIISGASRVKLRKKVRLRWDTRAQKYLLLYPERGLLLDATSAAIVKLCDGTRTVDAVAGELAARFRGDAERIRREVIEFLQKLDDRTLVEECA
jgi:coenzyme PQQ biosynthesis protein PqqD